MFIIKKIELIGHDSFIGKKLYGMNYPKYYYNIDAKIYDYFTHNHIKIPDYLLKNKNISNSLAFIAEITGLDEKYKFKRNFLKWQIDCTNANSTGSRGVYAYYKLDITKIYDIKEPVTWKKTDRYYCKIENGKIINISESEVIECLKLQLA